MKYFSRALLFVVGVALGGFVFASGAFAKDAIGSAKGLWMGEGGLAKMQVDPCGSGMLCAKIVWLRDPNDAKGVTLIDDNNGDARLRNRPIIGLPVAYDMKPAGASKWEGRVYDPKRGGSTYSGYMSLLRDGRMKVTGCLGIFCESEYWQPAKK